VTSLASVLFALTSLIAPLLQVSGENQASLQAVSDLLERHYETLARERTTSHEDSAHKVNLRDLLCDMQKWFLHLTGVGFDRQGGTPRMRGFKEILVPVERTSVVDHEDGYTPAARHLPIDNVELKRVLPRWLRALKSIFPCARIIFNIRRDVMAQANSGFHRKQGSRAEELTDLNAAIEYIHTERGDDKSFLLATEDLSTASLTRLAHWLVRVCTILIICSACPPLTTFAYT
jgi:hypothetical protein